MVWYVMASTSREDWIEEGFKILSDVGAGGLTVEALCDRLKRTKGSFYHHFGGRNGYVQALLNEWEKRSTDHLIAFVRSADSIEERLRRLNHRASEEGRPRLERAVRSWAMHEPLARRAQDSVDARRLEFLEGMLRERLGRGKEAARIARVLQLMFIGAQHLDPPFEGAELYQTFRAITPLFESTPSR
jgi:AcrR family transcriptional regulator